MQSIVENMKIILSNFKGLNAFQCTVRCSEESEQQIYLVKVLLVVYIQNFASTIKGDLMFRQLGAEADGGTAHHPHNSSIYSKDEGWLTFLAEETA